MRIAIAGGTGAVGRHVTSIARERGHDVSVLSRGMGVDVRTGAGLDEALAGADSVIDVANTMALKTRDAVEFFEAVSTTLLAAEKRAGVGHHVALSVVGIDDIDTSYYAGKLAQERVVLAAEVPHTLQRAGQFHEFAGQLLGQIRIGSLNVIPRALVRPVAAREVAARLVEVAEKSPQGRARDLVGPRDETLADMARRLLMRDVGRGRVLEVRLPGAYGRGLASGALRGDATADVASLTFDQWLRLADRERVGG